MEITYLHPGRSKGWAFGPVILKFEKPWTPEQIKQRRKAIEMEMTTLTFGKGRGRQAAADTSVTLGLLVNHFGLEPDENGDLILDNGDVVPAIQVAMARVVALKSPHIRWAKGVDWKGAPSAALKAYGRIADQFGFKVGIAGKKARTAVGAKSTDLVFTFRLGEPTLSEDDSEE